ARYSPRPGTEAEKMEDDVEVEDKKDREKKLMKILRKTALKNNQKYLGKIVKVLVEGQNKKGILFGKTETNKTVKFLGDKKYIGKFVKVKIEKVEDFGLRGVLGK
ncbi:MAG: TRAM domain-containing protein, partial [Patescibacteria group bacterium]|nr:TRAM domain-containing protein [Patescibacteria group bacterium]